MKSFNINNYVYVRLTPKGELVLRKHIENYREMFKEVDLPYNVDGSYPADPETGERKFQMWDFCKIFGNHMGLGLVNIMVDCIIRIEDKDLTDG